MKYQINLLSEKKESVFDRVIYFSLNYLRYILVITQIVVIFVFFYKFKVDQEIIDLKEAADQKKEIVEISKSLVDEAKLAEKKMKLIKPILDEQTNLVNQINYVLSIFPEPLFLTKFRYTQKQIALEGYSQDVNVIRQFYYQLSKDQKYKDLKLESLKKSTIGYQFAMTLAQYE